MGNSFLASKQLVHIAVSREKNFGETVSKSVKYEITKNDERLSSEEEKRKIEERRERDGQKGVMKEFLKNQYKDQKELTIRVFLVPLISAESPTKKLSREESFFLKLVNSFGIVHTGLQIGNQRFDWFDNSLVRIGALDFANCITCIYYPNPKKQTIENSDQNLDKISEFIVRWNLAKQYSNTLCNCQDFVIEFLKMMDIEHISQDNPMSRYLDYIRRCPPQESAPKVLIRKQNQEISWESHAKLDEWHIENEASLSEDELHLIKTFHRAFQLEEASRLGIPVERLDSRNVCPCGEFTIMRKA